MLPLSISRDTYNIVIIYKMGRFLFQLIGTIITLVVIGFIGYAVFTRLFQYWEEKEPLDDVVAVDIANTAKNISAKVSDLLIEHNINRDGKIGMNISSEQKFYHLKGTTCYTMIRFFDDEGKPIKGKNARDKNGNFCITGKLIPDDDECINSQRVFVAYDQFDLPNNGTVYFNCDIILYIVNANGESVELARSGPSRFHLSC